MPIFLDNLQANIANVKTYSPKFFDPKLTGVGKKTGVLNENRNPANIPAYQTTSQENLSIKKRHYTNGGTEVTIIPVNILSCEAWDYMTVLDVPDLAELTKIGEGPLANDPTKTVDVYIAMQPHSIVMEETRLVAQPGQKGSLFSGVSKKCTPSYQVILYGVLRGTGNKEATQVDAPSSLAAALDPRYATEFTCNPKKWVIEAMKQLNAIGFKMDAKAVDDYFDNYSLYEAMCKRSEEWQTTVHKFLHRYFLNTATIRNNNGSCTCMNVLAATLHRIEDYNIPLDLYRDIYASICQCFNQDDAEILCKENLSLLLSDTMHNLDKNKANLTPIPAHDPPVPVPIRKVPFSPEQRKAITCTDPLVLVQSGAGTGKSSTILGRIDWMIACGIQPQDIMVLSFTNAAADHITDLNPDVHSMTIARMIHTIYTANFPGHELSTLDTIMNSIDIYFGYDDIAVRFKQMCKAVWKNEPDGFTRMNNFVERHYDEVMNILDTIHQTSLELEIIICYQKIETLQEPDEVQSKYLIIDEVQDNSIFEFIYTLKYVDKHKEALFIVGKLRLPTLNPTNCGNTTHGLPVCA